MNQHWHLLWTGGSPHHPGRWKTATCRQRLTKSCLKAAPHCSSSVCTHQVSMGDPFPYCPGPQTHTLGLQVKQQYKPSGMSRKTENPLLLTPIAVLFFIPPAPALTLELESPGIPPIEECCGARHLFAMGKDSADEHACATNVTS